MEIKLTWFKPIEKVQSYLVDGLLTTNNDKNSVGSRCKEGLWIPFSVINLSKECLGKTLEYYCNEKGRVVKAELK